jgi:hypothetical protein
MTVAGCPFCGTIAQSRRPGGQPGEPAGPCPGCGRLMFWTTSNDARELVRRRAGRARAKAMERAREARRLLEGVTRMASGGG